ncbi:MAG: AsmA family protein, partial [Caulobacteraceae bacterium]
MSGPDPKAGAGAATSGPSRRRLHPLRWVGAAVLVLLAAIGVFIAVFQWNWLRGPIADYASGRLHRKVTIAGDLSGDVWTWTPWMTARGISVAEPGWAGPGPMAVLPSLT